MSLTDKIIRASAIAQVNQQLSYLKVRLNSASQVIVQIDTGGTGRTLGVICDLGNLDEAQQGQVGQAIVTSLQGAITDVVDENEQAIRRILGEKTSQAPTATTTFSDVAELAGTAATVAKRAATLVKDKFREFSDTHGGE